VLVCDTPTLREQNNNNNNSSSRDNNKSSKKTNTGAAITFRGHGYAAQEQGHHSSGSPLPLETKESEPAKNPKKTPNNTPHTIRIPLCWAFAPTINRKGNNAAQHSKQLSISISTYIYRLDAEEETLKYYNFHSRLRERIGVETAAAGEEDSKPYQ